MTSHIPDALEIKGRIIRPGNMTVHDKKKYFTKSKESYICGHFQRHVVKSSKPPIWLSTGTKHYIQRWRDNGRFGDNLYNLIQNELELLCNSELPLPPFFPYHINDFVSIVSSRLDSKIVQSGFSERAYEISKNGKVVDWLPPISSSFTIWKNKLRTYRRKRLFHHGPDNEFYTIYSKQAHSEWAFNANALRSLSKAFHRFNGHKIPFTPRTHPENPRNWGGVHWMRVYYGDRIIGHPNFNADKWMKNTSPKDLRGLPRWARDVICEQFYNNPKYKEIPMKDTKFESQGNTEERFRIQQMVIEEQKYFIECKDKLIDTQTEHLQAVRKEVKRNRDLLDSLGAQVEEYKDKYKKLQKGVKWMISQSKDVQELAEEEVA